MRMIQINKTTMKHSKKGRSSQQLQRKINESSCLVWANIQLFYLFVSVNVDRFYAIIEKHYAIAALFFFLHSFIAGNYIVFSWSPKYCIAVLLYRSSKSDSANFM